ATATSQVQALELILSPDQAVQVACEAICPTRCEWRQCHAELNSWIALQEHLHRHCHQLEASSSSQANTFHCQAERCAVRLHDSLPSLLQHITFSHMSRVPLPCPVEGCSEAFTYKQAPTAIPAHLQTEHRFGGSFPTRLPPLRQSRTPKKPPRRSLPPLPPDQVPLYTLLLPPVREKHRRAGATASQTARRGRWKRMSSRAAAPDSSSDADEPESMPFPDLDPQTAYYSDRQNECLEWVAYKAPPEPALQISRPQPMIIPPVREKPPARSIGYVAFAEKFAQLELAGIIDGLGQWPQEESEKDGEAQADARQSRTPGKAKGKGKSMDMDKDKMDLDGHDHVAGPSSSAQGSGGG
ncbi:hypothetical protein C8T65DRAFT_649776, partial [Cerioporus squamosus]